MYQAILISPDGIDYVTDCHNSKTIQDVWKQVNDFGSKWFFYPIAFVISESKTPIMRKRILSSCDGFAMHKNTTVQQAMDAIKLNQDYVKSVLH